MANQSNHSYGHCTTDCATVNFHHKQATPTWVIPVPSEIFVPDNVLHHHTHVVVPNQCYSSVVLAIDAPIATMWSIVCRFDNPQAYKHTLKSCHMIEDGNVETALGGSCSLPPTGSVQH
ncbi:abscisic acid receptor PYL4-like [Forsythia ovata]|uniref:Abscisic acid receptor PYL4-like n=1 Tax=Forsythia ovata TaxID=205694 RepID=A0ABD1WJY6_9LAMI